MILHEDLVERHTDESGELQETDDFLNQDAVSFSRDELDEVEERFEDGECVCFQCDFCPMKNRCL